MCRHLRSQGPSVRGDDPLHAKRSVQREAGELSSL
jgi:hypothetical protein